MTRITRIGSISTTLGESVRAFVPHPCPLDRPEVRKSQGNDFTKSNGYTQKNQPIA